MSKTKYHIWTKVIEVDGAFYEVDRINNDVNGNPRYVVHFREFGLSQDDYTSNRYNVSKYRANWYGGGIVFTTYHIENSIRYERDRINVKRKQLNKLTLNS